MDVWARGMFLRSQGRYPHCVHCLQQIIELYKSNESSSSSLEENEGKLQYRMYLKEVKKKKRILILEYEDSLLSSFQYILYS